MSDGGVPAAGGTFTWSNSMGIGADPIHTYKNFISASCPTKM